jgi:SAM-dependent methyltransferase
MRPLRPSTPDAARKVVQEPCLRAAAAVCPPRGRCLNAGSGRVGPYSEFLESFTAVTEIVNVDINAPEIAARRSDPRHRDVHGSVTELPFEDGSFDWVLCTGVLPFVEDDSEAARELGRVLRAGGCALVSVRLPSERRDERWNVREARGLERILVHHGYTPEALSELLSRGGLDVVWEGRSYHRFMTWLSVLWRWQYVRLGRGRRNLMPRALVLAFGHADRLLPLGPAHDLVVLARKRAGGAP